jgi:hypothetical protein
LELLDKDKPSVAKIRDIGATWIYI